MSNNLTQIKVSLVEAMARQEGWLDPNSRCRRNHNPGNLEYGSFSIRNGATGKDGRFAVFPSDEIGFAALVTLLSGPHYADLSIELAIHKFAPSYENDTKTYINRICEWSGNSPSTVIKTLVPLTYERYLKDTTFRTLNENIASVTQIDKPSDKLVTNKDSKDKGKKV